jgi:hypothetical protein
VKATTKLSGVGCQPHVLCAFRLERALGGRTHFVRTLTHEPTLCVLSRSFCSPISLVMM